MARRLRRPRPTQAKTLTPVATHCPECGHALWATHSKYRTVTTLDAVTRLTLRVRRCPNPDCPRYRRPCRPESEALVALPHHEFGLDVLAFRTPPSRRASQRPRDPPRADPPRRRHRPALGQQPPGPLR